MPTTFSKADYGPDPKNPWLENSSNGWGSYAWPEGVPSNLLGTFKTKDGTNITVRRELVALAKMLVEASEDLLGYKFHTLTGGNTGGYSNRSIRGGDGPSSHSRGRAIDTRALDNPQSYVFICVIPPSVIKLWEACGWYWGGRYTGAPLDTQHLSYIGMPKDVPIHIAKATKLIHKLKEADDMQLTDKVTKIRDPLATPIDQTYDVQEIFRKQVNYLGSLVNLVQKLNTKVDDLTKKVNALEAANGNSTQS